MILSCLFYGIKPASQTSGMPNTSSQGKNHLAIISVRQQDGEPILTHPLLFSTRHELIKDNLQEEALLRFKTEVPVDNIANIHLQNLQIELQQSSKSIPQEDLTAWKRAGSTESLTRIQVQTLLPQMELLSPLASLLIMADMTEMQKC